MSVPEAILDMIRGALPGVTVYDGRVPDGPDDGQPPARYVVVYIDNGTWGPDGLVCHSSSSAVFRWQVNCVAPDRGMASWLADKVRGALVDQRLAVTGWSAGLIEHTFSQPARPDEQVPANPVLVTIDQYRLLAERH